MYKMMAKAMMGTPRPTPIPAPMAAPLLFSDEAGSLGLGEAGRGEVGTLREADGDDPDVVPDVVAAGVEAGVLEDDGVGVGGVRGSVVTKLAVPRLKRLVEEQLQPPKSAQQNFPALQDWRPLPPTVMVWLAMYGAGG